MAKKKDREKDRPSRADAVRSAVDQAFQATAGGAAALTRERATDLADELSGVVARLRETVDEARPASGGDLGDLREQVEALRVRLDALDGLAARVDALEAAGSAAPAAAPAAAAKAAPKRAPRARAATTQAAAKRAQAAAKGPGRRTTKADSGVSEAASAGTASDGDVRQASAAARTTRARAAGKRAS